MILYLLKMSLCSAVLLLFYRVFLEKEKMLRFNRFFLLGSLVVSLVLPLVPVEIITVQRLVTPPANLVAMTEAGVPATFAVRLFPQPSLPEETSWLWLAGVLYLAVSGGFLLQFGRNLFALLSRIRSHETTRSGDMKLVLLDTPTVPHSFLGYVFVNKSDYQSHKLEIEIMDHERTHVRQRHTLDVLFVELLKVAFWINPVFYLYRNAIALNHEFLADEAVICHLPDHAAYQHLLLRKSAVAANLPFTSKFNYSFTKKRFIMMNKQTSRTKALLVKIAMLPLLGAALFVFSDKIMAQKSKPAPAQTVKPKPVQKEYVSHAGISDEELEEYKALVDKYRTTAKPSGDVVVPDGDRQRLVMLDKAMSQTQQGTLNFMILEGFGPLRSNPPTKAELEKYKDPYIYGVWIDGKKVPNMELDKYEASDFSQVYNSILHGKAKNVKGKYKYKFQLDLMTTDYYEAYRSETLASNQKFMYLRTRRIPVKN